MTFVNRLYASFWLNMYLTIHLVQYGYINVLVQDCSNSSALAMELLQSSAKPSIFTAYKLTAYVYSDFVHTAFNGNAHYCSMMHTDFIFFNVFIKCVCSIWIDKKERIFLVRLPCTSVRLQLILNKMALYLILHFSLLLCKRCNTVSFREKR